MGKDAGRDKVAYIGTSPDPMKAGPILRGGGVVLILFISPSTKY